jgi:biotin synthase
MDGFLCGLESPNEKIYQRFRPGGDTLNDRLNTLFTSKELKLKVWSGFLVGLGESEEDVSLGLNILEELEVDSMSILPFIPVPETEMMKENLTNPFWWSKVMAIARIYNEKPDLFSDQTNGCYAPYSQLGGPNGYYTFPGKV